MAYRTFEHTADVGIEAEADDVATLFAETARALFEVMRGDAKVEPRRRHDLQVAADAVAPLLVRFLEEFVFLQDAERLVFADVADVTVHEREGSWEARGVVTGEPYAHARHADCLQVKAITRHGLDVALPGPGRRGRARVILDI